MLSVIVPVYNAEEYLRKCVDSILYQTYSDLELLLINDGSTDSSGVVCDEYARKDYRVRVIHKENGGVSSTRNLGLDLAKGEYITFVDADDWIEHETYEKIFSQIESTETDICCYDFTVVYPHRIGYLHTPDVSGSKDDFLQRWLRFNLTSLCAMVVRKDIYDDNHLRCPIQNYCEDFSLSVRLLFYANKVSKIDYCGYNYNRLNANSLVNNLNEKAAEEELAVYQGILDFFAEKGVLAQYEEPVAWRILKSTQHLILDSASHGRFKEVFPSRYSKYIFTVPSSYLVNTKIKIMAWLLCHRMGMIVRYINILRTILKR